MPVYEGCHETVVPGSPEDAFAVMTDVEHLPDWQGPLKRATVLSRDDEGLAREVEYEIDVKLRTVKYVLRHDYDAPRRIGSTYVEGDFECFEGQWEFERDEDGATRARFDLRVDPGLPLPGRITKMLNDRVLRSSVEDLRKRLEERG